MQRVLERDVLTPEQVAEYLQVRRETIYKYIRKGKLPAFRLGRSYRVTREDLDIFLLANRTASELRGALFERVLQIAGVAPPFSPSDVEEDVALAVAAARRSPRA